MASHPVFGEIPGQTKRQTDSKQKSKAQKAEKGAGAEHKKTQEKGTNVNKAFNKPTIFCQGYR